MTIHQLQSFLAVAEKQSFTAAADALYISQSALSQQIRQLEHQLGFQLFDRSTRQVTLTEAGRSFYRNAQQLQALYAHALSEGQQLQQLSSCHIKHFCIGCLGDQFFQLWGDLFRIAMPSAEQYASRSVRYESKEALYTALLRGEAQIAALLENKDIHRIGLDFLPFARVPELCLFAPGALPVGSDPLPRIHLEELQDYLVLFTIIPAPTPTKTVCVATCGNRCPNCSLWTLRTFSPILPLAPTSRCCSRPFSTAATLRRFPWTGARGID